ncbi:MAG: restriction endonuclease subunit S [Actinobacteria bacterium]|nr:restriction endonuclease subunit S [Actinomycetota bacterium]
MKETGLPWLNEAPEHWKLLPNRALMRQRKVLVGELHTDYRLLSLTKQGVIVRDITGGKGKFSANMGTFQEVRIGDLIFCLFDVPETPRTVGLSPHDGMITGAYAVFECPDPLLSAFLDLFYRAMDDRKLLSPLYSGLRNTIPTPRLLSTKTPVPPSAEQAAIVRFLNHVDRRILRAIRAKQKLIALLNEQKQTVIHRSVTRGLDPDVRLRRSGVDSLGDVPEHWHVVRLKNILRAIDERSTTGAETLLSLRRDHGVVRFAEHFSRPPQGSTAVGYKLVAPSQIVVNRLQANNGLIFASEISGVISPDYSVFSVAGSASPEYVTAVLRTPNYRAHFRRVATGLGTGTAGFLRLYDDDLLTTRIALPPYVEQRRIMASLDAGTAKTIDAIDHAEREVTLLGELRVRLIADVVTGKLDVRAVSARLPDELDESELLDEIDLEQWDETEVDDLESVEA